MAVIQSVLVYLTLALAVGYVAKKYLLPKRLFVTKKNTKTCGQNDCGCH